MTDNEIDEAILSQGCTFGEGKHPYYVQDVLHSLQAARQALKALALCGQSDGLWSWCDDGWMCTHHECRLGRRAMGIPQ